MNAVSHAIFIQHITHKTVLTRNIYEDGTDL